MRARIFRRLASDTYEYVGEMEADDAEDVWRQLQGEAVLGVGGLAEGDVVYIADVYHQLDGDGGWAIVPPSALTKHLYELATSADSAR
jgi:hypothetical protein